MLYYSSVAHYEYLAFAKQTSVCVKLCYLFFNHGVLCAPQSMQTYVEAMQAETGFLFLIYDIYIYIYIHTYTYCLNLMYHYLFINTNTQLYLFDHERERSQTTMMPTVLV